MGLVQDVHAAVTRYEGAARSTTLTAHTLATAIANVENRLASHGPLGVSTDPDLVRARAWLTTARQRLLSAAEATEASRTRARTYADHTFPL